MGKIIKNSILYIVKELKIFYKISKEETKHYNTNKQTNVKKKERIAGQRKYRPLILHK